MGETRVFTHNVVNDTTMHMMFGYGNGLIHVWKNYNNGQGSWTSEIIDTSSVTLDNDWFTASTVKDDDLYLFYCKKSTGDFSSSRIYYKRWNQTTQTWTAPTLVSGSHTSNRDPNTCFHVPSNSDYIPIFWNSAESGFQVYFSKIIVGSGQGVDDTGDLPTPRSSVIYSNYPNPFNNNTTISYFIAQEGSVQMTVYDMLGRLTTQLVDEIQPPGWHSVDWNSDGKATGVYYCVLSNGEKESVSKMTLLK